MLVSVGYVAGQRNLALLDIQVNVKAFEPAGVLMFTQVFYDGLSDLLITRRADLRIGVLSERRAAGEQNRGGHSHGETSHGSPS